MQSQTLSPATMRQSASAPPSEFGAMTSLPAMQTTLSYPERIPAARLEATLLNRELDDTLFDARLRASARAGTVAEPAAWIGGSASTSSVDALLLARRTAGASAKPLRPLEERAGGGHGACYTLTLPVGETAIDRALGALLAQSREKAAGLRTAVRRALTREEALLAEVQTLRNEVSRGARLRGASNDPRRDIRDLFPDALDALEGVRDDTGRLEAALARFADAERRLGNERDAALEKLAVAEGAAARDRKSLAARDSELEATVSRLDSVRVEVAARRQIALRKEAAAEKAAPAPELPAPLLAALAHMLGAEPPGEAEMATYYADPEIGPSLARLRAHINVGDDADAASRASAEATRAPKDDASLASDGPLSPLSPHLADAPAPSSFDDAYGGAPAPAPGSAPAPAPGAAAGDDESIEHYVLGNGQRMKAVYLSGGRRIWVNETPFARPPSPRALELAASAEPEEDDEAAGIAAREAAAARTVVAAHDLVRAAAVMEGIALGWANAALGTPLAKDWATDPRLESGDAYVEIVGGLLDAGFFPGGAAAAAFAAARLEPPGIARTRAALAAVHPCAAAVAVELPEGEPHARRLHAASLLGCALLGACGSAAHVLEEPAHARLLTREARRKAPSAVPTVAAMLADVDVQSLVAPKPDRCFELIAAIYAARCGPSAALGGASMASVARKYLTKKYARRSAADTALGELALGVDQLARDYALPRLFARLAGVPRGLRAKRASFGVPAVFSALEASAANDPLASPRALDFFEHALTALVPRDGIAVKLGAREEQVLDLGRVKALAPTLFEDHVFGAHALFPRGENPPLEDRAFYVALAAELDDRSSRVEPDPVSLNLRVKTTDALEALVAAWPGAATLAATEARRVAARGIQRLARGAAARVSGLRARRSRALALETRRVEREFRKVDVRRDGVLTLEVFGRMLRALDARKSTDDALVDYELAVDASRRHRARNVADFGDEDDDPDARDALVVGEVVHVLTQGHLRAPPPPGPAFAIVPVEPTYAHNTWGRNRDRTTL